VVFGLGVGSGGMGGLGVLGWGVFVVIFFSFVFGRGGRFWLAGGVVFFVGFLYARLRFLLCTQ